MGAFFSYPVNSTSEMVADASCAKGARGNSNPETLLTQELLAQEFFGFYTHLKDQKAWKVLNRVFGKARP